MREREEGEEFLRTTNSPQKERVFFPSRHTAVKKQNTPLGCVRRVRVDEVALEVAVGHERAQKHGRVRAGVPRRVVPIVLGRTDGVDCDAAVAASRGDTYLFWRGASLPLSEPHKVCRFEEEAEEEEAEEERKKKKEEGK